MLTLEATKQGGMTVPKINAETLDKIAELEAQCILDGLNDPQMRKNPAFLEKVRKFLAQNNLVTTPETPGIRKIQKATEDIPVFTDGVN